MRVNCKADEYTQGIQLTYFDRMKQLLSSIVVSILIIVCFFFEKEHMLFRGCQITKSFDLESEYIQRYPNGNYVEKVRKMILSYDDWYFSQYFSSNSQADETDLAIWEEHKNEYYRLFQNGKYYSAICSFINYYRDEIEYRSLLKQYSRMEALNKYLSIYPAGIHAKDATIEIDNLRALYSKNGKRSNTLQTNFQTKKEPEAEISYINNYLATGSQPYADRYGWNGRFEECAITVVSSADQDVVVIIKKWDKSGPVAGHAYIRKESSYTINLHPGTYQAFFYRGIGWDPNKKRKNGLTGGFVSGENYGAAPVRTLNVKTDVYEEANEIVTQYMYDAITYSLSTLNGNLSLKTVNENDVF